MPGIPVIGSILGLARDMSVIAVTKHRFDCHFVQAINHLPAPNALLTGP
jgi:hypothetical protein